MNDFTVRTLPGSQWEVDKAPPPPVRVKLLNEAVRLTNGERDKEYGPPRLNLELAGELKKCMRKHATRALSSAEWDALDMVASKLSRVLTGIPKADTYTDGAAYFAIAGELGLEDQARPA